MLNFDAETGILHAEAGVTLDEIIRVFLPRGFFPPVVPGTRFVTLGGSIAADIHGKSHHRDSSLATHVLWFDLMLASGEVRRCSREENGDLFWATVGGMGLTGVILEVATRLRRVESAYIKGEIIRVANVDEAIENFERTDREYGCSAAWIDCVAPRARSGARCCTSAISPRAMRCPPTCATSRWIPKEKGSPAVPFNLPNFALNSLSVRAFNYGYFAMHRNQNHGDHVIRAVLFSARFD